MAPTKLRIGFIPEHFSTPLHFAQKHYGLSAELIPFPTGTGALVSGLKSSDPNTPQIDVAIGLTEGFVADLGKAKAAGESTGYGLVGTYVDSPLCWAISAGAGKDGIKSVEDLKNSRVGVSRIGSGSYVMSFVLADQQGWLESGSGKDPFEVVPIGDFKALRDAVNGDKADFFMWEHFTTKHFWDVGEIKRIGEIYTPWPSWMVAAKEGTEEAVKDLMEKLDQGVKHYLENSEEAVEHITSTMQYSKEDAREWMKTVKFSGEVRGVSAKTVDDTVGVLRKAGVLRADSGGSEHMILVQRD
jgi:ABC-type nitrate/sulfonate/bicarbonate transport system substrate-binding protein